MIIFPRPRTDQFPRPKLNIPRYPRNAGTLPTTHSQCTVAIALQSRGADPHATRRRCRRVESALSRKHNLKLSKQLKRLKLCDALCSMRLRMSISPGAPVVSHTPSPERWRRQHPPAKFACSVDGAHLVGVDVRFDNGSARHNYKLHTGDFTFSAHKTAHPPRTETNLIRLDGAVPCWPCSQ